MGKMIDWAMWYHNQGICVVPCKPADKAVDLPTWEEYQTRQSTEQEITRWWEQSPTRNIGLVHGVGGFVSIDFDHDAGALDAMRAKFPQLFTGRIEQSGSGEGYHLPLFVANLPNLGYDNSKERPKGNKTWHCKNGHDMGDVNIRARWCQTVVPPSLHPSGGRYKFIQKGDIIKADSLDDVIVWLNGLDAKAAPIVRRRERPANTKADKTLDDLKAHFPSLLDTFAALGYGGQTRRENNGEARISGYGGLVVDDQQGRWYNFSDEVGGDVIDAFGWAQFGSGWDRYNKAQFVAAVNKMKDLAGLGDIRVALPTVPQRMTSGTNRYWGR